MRLGFRAEYAAVPRLPSGRIKPGELRRLSDRLSVAYGTLKNIVDGFQWKHVSGGVH